MQRCNWCHGLPKYFQLKKISIPHPPPTWREPTCPRAQAEVGAMQKRSQVEVYASGNVRPKRKCGLEEANSIRRSQRTMCACACDAELQRAKKQLLA